MLTLQLWATRWATKTLSQCKSSPCEEKKLLFISARKVLQHHYKAKELSISEMGLHGYFLGSLSNYITTYAFPIYNIKID